MELGVEYLQGIIITPLYYFIGVHMSEELVKVKVVGQVEGYEPFQAYAERLAGLLITNLELNQDAGLNPRYVKASVENVPTEYTESMLEYVMYECYLSEWGVGSCGNSKYHYETDASTFCTMEIEIEMVGGTDEPLAV